VDDLVRITVQDDGPGLPSVDVAAPTGIGLANTRARLREMYGAAATLTVENADGGGVVATMIVPLRAAREGACP
jgi:signal transduction histidine kinase